MTGIFLGRPPAYIQLLAVILTRADTAYCSMGYSHGLCRETTSPSRTGRKLVVHGYHVVNFWNVRVGGKAE
jgi:hypothetical protein